jgi:transcriptional antiterminator
VRPRKKKAGGKPSDKRPPRSSKAELDNRRSRVAQLYLVQAWTADKIAKLLGVSRRTIERDIEKIRQDFRRYARENYQGAIRDVIHTLWISFERKRQLLWSDLAGLTQQLEDEKLSQTNRSKTQRERRAVLRQIGKHEEEFTEQLRRLGITGVVTGDEDEYDILVQIKKRHAQRLGHDSGGSSDADSSKT